MWIAARRYAALMILVAGSACSGGDESPEAPAADPRARQARCSQEVTRICGELQRAEQVACVSEEMERCMLGDDPTE